MNTRETRRSRRLLLVVCALIVIHFLLIFSAGAIGSHKFLFLFFFVTLVLLPGFLAASILFPDARMYYKLLLSMVLGAAQVFVLLLVFSIFNWNLFYIAILVPILCLTLAVFESRGSFGGFDLPENQPLSRPAIIIMLIVVVLVSILTLGIGDPLLYTGDAQDHIAYIRAITRSHEAFPTQFIYKDGGILTRDIRRGLLHSMWGTVNLLTNRTEVYPVWPVISWIGSLFLLLGIFCLGVQLFGNQGIAILGVIFYILFFQRGLAGHHMITAAYGFHFGKMFFYAFFICALLYMRTSRREFLALAALASLGATGTHIGYFMIIYFFMFILIVVEWFQTDKGLRQAHTARPALFLLGATFIINIPYLLLRYLRDYSPGNEIHSHVQGMLFFGDNLAVLNPILFFQSDGILLAVAFIALFMLWKKSREDKNLRLVLWLAAGVFILAFNPLWVPFIMAKITYLLVRFSVAVPTMLIAAYLFYTLWEKVRGRTAQPSWFTAIAGGLVVVVLLLSPLAANWSEFAYAGSHRRAREHGSLLNLKGLFADIEAKIPSGSVIASDPLTSYGLLAFTDHFVVCTYDQHSTPNDSTALDRITACRNMYLPFVGCAEVAQALDEYGAEYVVINGRIPRDIPSDYWKSDKESAEMAAEKLSGCEMLFEPVFSGDDVYVFKCLGPSGALSGVSPEDQRERPAEPPGLIRGTFTGDLDQLTPSGVDGIYIGEHGQDATTIQRGQSLALYVDWVAEGSREIEKYVIYVRFDTDFEKGSLYKPGYGKIYRKILEKIKGEKYRFRVDRLPFDGSFPPDEWPQRTILRQHIDVPIPTGVAPGTYTISIKLDNAPHVSNLRMKDLLRDDDFYDGPDLMTVIVE